MRRCIFALMAVLASAPLSAQSQRERGYLFREPPVSITLHGGLGAPQAAGDLWAANFDELTLGRRDLRAFDRGADIAVRLSPRLDLVLSYGVSDVTRQTELRDWLDENGFPIRQSTRFARRPLGAGLRYNFVDRGRMLGNYAWVPTSFVPFVGVSVGTMAYRLDQQGEFVDSETAEIFEDAYRASGRTGFVQGSVGAGITLIPSLVLTGEIRYLAAGSDGRPSFLGYDRLDLSGFSSLIGLSLRLH
jgi:hypothetical protein